MPNILCIDTSTDICSVILGDDNGVLIERISREGRDHSAKAGVFADEILKEAKEKGIDKIDAVAVCSGPGSYTGLRIGVSLAKGLCYGYNIPLIGIDSLKLMARQARDQHNLPQDAILCPMIDARRMEVYTSQWDTEINMKGEPEAKIIDEESYQDIEAPFYYFGTGAEKLKETLSKENFNYIADIYPMAEGLLAPALDAYKAEAFEDVAYFEPFYLKQFQTTVSKKNVLGL